jgi:hypothetical protein
MKLGDVYDFAWTLILAGMVIGFLRVMYSRAVT